MCDPYSFAYRDGSLMARRNAVAAAMNPANYLGLALLAVWVAAWTAILYRSGRAMLELLAALGWR